MRQWPNNAERLTLKRWCGLVVFAILGWLLSPAVLGQVFGSNAGGLSMGGPSSAPGSETANSEEQLRQLKQSLLSLAMQRKARVAASGWTNSAGTLREDVMVFSELELEKLRPVVRSNRYGGETTELANLGDTLEKMCAAQPIRPQRLGLAINLSSNTSPANQNLARHAADLVVSELRNAKDLGVLGSAAVLNRRVAQDSHPVSTYHRYMTAGPVQQQDLQLQIATVVEQDTPVFRRFVPVEVVRAPKRLTIDVALLSNDKPVTRWRKRVAVESSSRSKRDQMAWLAIPEASKTALTRWLARIASDLNSAISCYGETSIGLAASGTQPILHGGRDIGVYAGQRLAILPTSDRMRDRGLHSSVGVVGLAEVLQVGPHSATLNVYAGPRVGDFTGMMAVPMAELTP